MKFKTLAAMVFLIAGCAVQPAQRPQPIQTQPGPVENASPNTLSRDAYDCERQAALAGVGDRTRAFDDCMRARGRTPGR
jgi:hypothetical protein